MYVWSSSTGVLYHKLAGHDGSVNETSMNKHNVIASGSSDKSIYLGELKL